MLYLLALVNAVMAVAFALVIRRLPPEIPLFYSSEWGEGRLGHPYLLLLIPLLMNLFFVISRFIHISYFRRDRQMGKIVVIAQLVYIVMSSIAFLRIIFLVK